eukprot:4009941-Prymnesium_polylepis.1
MKLLDRVEGTILATQRPQQPRGPLLQCCLNAVLLSRLSAGGKDDSKSVDEPELLLHSLEILAHVPALSRLAVYDLYTQQDHRATLGVEHVADHAKGEIRAVEGGMREGGGVAICDKVFREPARQRRLIIVDQCDSARLGSDKVVVARKSS